MQQPINGNKSFFQAESANQSICIGTFFLLHMVCYEYSWVDYWDFLANYL